jgi:hypothetical protein
MVSSSILDDLKKRDYLLDWRACVKNDVLRRLSEANFPEFDFFPAGNYGLCESWFDREKSY